MILWISVVEGFFLFLSMARSNRQLTVKALVSSSIPSFFPFFLSLMAFPTLISCDSLLRKVLHLLLSTYKVLTANHGTTNEHATYQAVRHQVDAVYPLNLKNSLLCSTLFSIECTFMTIDPRLLWNHKLAVNKNSYILSTLVYFYSVLYLRSRIHV